MLLNRDTTMKAQNALILGFFSWLDIYKLGELKKFFDDQGGDLVLRPLERLITDSQEKIQLKRL